MSRHSRILSLVTAIIIVVSFATTALGVGKQECLYAVELYSGLLKKDQPLPPVYPQMWIINYPQNVYSAADADALFRRDFELDSLTKLGSYRIIKDADDSVMFMNTHVAMDNDKGWQYQVRSNIRLNRQIDRLDNFIYRSAKEMYPFTIEMIINSPVVFCFRADSTSKDAILEFFSYTLYKNFPKHVLSQFDTTDKFAELGYDPFLMKFPTESKKPEPLFEPEAEYPPNLKTLKRSDTVQLMLLVDRDGTVSHVEVVKKSRYSQFDISAKNACYEMLFKPAVDATGNTVPSWVQHQIVFDYTK